jgi:tellurite resistance protein TerC
MEVLPIWAWAAFVGFIVLMLALDLGVFNRKSHVIKTREALAWVAVWVTLALAFNTLIYFWRGHSASSCRTARARWWSSPTACSPA